MKMKKSWNKWHSFGLMAAGLAISLPASAQERDCSNPVDCMVGGSKVGASYVVGMPEGSERASGLEIHFDDGISTSGFSIGKVGDRRVGSFKLVGTFAPEEGIGLTVGYRNDTDYSFRNREWVAGAGYRTGRFYGHGAFISGTRSDREHGFRHEGSGLEFMGHALVKDLARVEGVIQTMSFKEKAGDSQRFGVNVEVPLGQKGWTLDVAALNQRMRTVLAEDSLLGAAGSEVNQSANQLNIGVRKAF